MCPDNRGGGRDVEAGERALGAQLNVLSEAEAAALVAKQPASSSSDVITPSSSTSHASDSPYLALQQPPFRLRGANKGYL